MYSCLYLLTHFPCPLRLLLKKHTLAFHTPAVASQGAVVAHHAVTGDRDCQFVCRASLCHSPNRLGSTDTPGNIGVAYRLPCRNSPQCLPHALLESRAAHIQRQVQPDAWRFDKADYLGDKLFEARIPANQPGVRKAVLQITYKFVGIVAKQN